MDPVVHAGTFGNRHPRRLAEHSLEPIWPLEHPAQRRPIKRWHHPATICITTYDLVPYVLYVLYDMSLSL